MKEYMVLMFVVMYIRGYKIESFPEAKLFSLQSVWERYRKVLTMCKERGLSNLDKYDFTEN